MQLGQADGLSEGEEKDPLYNEAVSIMIESGRGSVSLIQRRLNIGYSRASRIIDQLRRTGIVGAYKGSMASEVMITAEQWEQMKTEMGVTTNGVGVGDGDPAIEGNTAANAGTGKHAGYAQQYNSNFDPTDDDDNGVPDEMPGEHRQ
jgi:S-DNA-T family DNA segregation ATPase FtsK/SpoIIIE